MYKSKGRLKKFISLGIALIFIMSAIPSHASNFSDISNHWGKSHIDRMHKLKLMNGYPDGSFQPEGNVTYLESFQLMANLIDADNSEKQEAQNKYGAVISSLNLNWGQEALAIALNRGVISESELKGFTKTKFDSPAKRIEIGEYLVKAMGLEEMAEEKIYVVLPYEDANKIPKSKDKYVEVLKELKVMEGDNRGYFNPNQNVKRAEIAKMLSVSYDYMLANPVEAEVEENIVTEEGQFKSLTGGTGNRYLLLNQKGALISYKVNESSIEVIIGGKPASLSDLKEDQFLKIEVIDGPDREVRRIEAGKVEEALEEYSGKIKYLYPSSSKLRLEYEEDNKVYTKEFEVEKDAEIYLDRKPVNLEKLKEGDLAKVKTKNNSIYDIEATSKIQKLEGSLVEVKKDKENEKDYYLTIVDKNDKLQEYLVDEKAYITRDGKEVDLKDLKYKDEIFMELEYDKIIDVDARILKRELKGYIVGKNEYWDKKTEIIIRELKTREEEAFTLDEYAVVKLDNKNAIPSDIKIGYYVDLYLEGDEIVKLYADSKSAETTLTGEIIRVDPSNEKMTISVLSHSMGDNLYGEEIEVFLSEKPIILHIQGSKTSIINFRSLSKKDRVELKGRYEGGRFIANRIILSD